MKDKDISGLIDNAREALDLIDDVREKVHENTVTEDTVDLDDDMVRTATVYDDEVKLTAEVGDISVDELTVGYVDGYLEIGVGKDIIQCNVPDDIQVGKLELSVNNGVLAVELPRSGGDQ